MNLSKKDRVILINQYQILSILDTQQASYYEELIEILTSGYQIFYSMIDEWIDDDIPEEDGRFVLDVLSLYRAIEAYKRSNENEEISSHSWGYFQGFDGNNETSHMLFARFLIMKQGKFPEQEQYLSQNDSCNSHRTTISKYTNMIAKWDEFSRSYELTSSQTLEILNSSW